MHTKKQKRRDIDRVRERERESERVRERKSERKIACGRHEG
jgi:hypothetical protein